jgi:hypothetical protein
LCRAWAPHGALPRHGELSLAPEVRATLRRISAATSDRLPRSEKRRPHAQEPGEDRTSRLLRQQVPIRTVVRWDELQRGAAELDLVAHDGGLARGNFVHTLTQTGIATTWTQASRLPQQGAGVGVCGPAPRAGTPALPAAGYLCRQRGRAPEPPPGGILQRAAHHLHPQPAEADKRHLLCRAETRARRVTSRACLGSIPTRPAVCSLKLEAVASDEANSFVPSSKLVAKVRHGAKAVTRYDQPETPLERVLASPHPSDELPETVRQRALTLNLHSP